MAKGDNVGLPYSLLALLTGDLSSTIAECARMLELILYEEAASSTVPWSSVDKLTRQTVSSAANRVEESRNAFAASIQEMRDSLAGVKAALNDLINAYPQPTESSAELSRALHIRGFQ